jgi:Ca-activated chloride channel family protein
MSLTPSRTRAALLFALSVFFLCEAATAQDNPNRPPWAQKPKPDATTAKPPASGPAPASGPVPGPVFTPVPAPPAADPQDPASQRGTIRVKVNLVNVLTSVLDDKNRPAPDLPIGAFQLFEEGVLQKIEVFEPETKQPLDLALMIDASMSAHKEMAFEQEAAAHFIRQVLRPGDSLSVFSFDESVKQLAPFSENVSTLQQAVHKIVDGTGTSIYDAVVLGSRALEKRGEDRRRVIILVTDAGETTSRADFEAARKEAVRSNTLLYTIVIRPVKNESGRNTAGEHAIETITDTTGGAMFFPDTPPELDIIFDRIDRELRTQYRLGYYPNPRGPANAYRGIEVKVLGTYHVRHRKNYFTGAP